MTEFILNNREIRSEMPEGSTVLDLVRYDQNLKGTKIGCREGDCGACTILVGELKGEKVIYRTMTSCLMPLANAAGKHIVTVEGINPQDGSLTPVQQAMVDESGTQCGFCTVGFVMSLTAFCIDDTEKTPEMAVSAVDGNICRCTGYRSIERAGTAVCQKLNRENDANSSGSKVPAGGSLSRAIDTAMVPEYFSDIASRLRVLRGDEVQARRKTPAVLPVAGGTDIYVQRPDAMPRAAAEHVFYDDALRGIRDAGEFIEMGASTTVTDLLESRVMRSVFPDLYKHLKLVSSTPIRNMATLAGNFVNASPIGDMTVWFLALDAEIALSSPGPGGEAVVRTIPLREFYLGYKQLARSENEIITSIRFRKPSPEHRFNFEKVSKRKYLDISTVNTAIFIKCTEMPGAASAPDFLKPPRPDDQPVVDYIIEDAQVSAGGVAPIPLYLKETSNFLSGKHIDPETIAKANEIMQFEISPISDVRGSEDYKRLLLRQLFKAHFVELFGQNTI
jgi:xanthine dehydrogenase small subunit